MSFLYTIFDNPFARKALSQVEIPNSISDNLRFDIREYQDEAFKRFIYQDTEDFEGKPNKPLHLLYNMATGSGKTMVMAGLILYLYHKGHRNFLFFVNSSNIIEKTKDNFLNNTAKKYLFADKIVIDGKQVLIKEVDNFQSSDTENINIKFTTIQQLHMDLNNAKENALTFEDFADQKIVLIADEAHHLSSGTKQKELFEKGNWENTVSNILNQNFDNILLEFTATLDYDSKEIVTKYQDKVLYKYDLAQFRLDKYSKEINLIRSSYGERERILQALLLSLYRQTLATTNNINLKPVILFKAKRTIAESEQNKQNFHTLIDELEAGDIDNLRKTSSVSIVAKACSFFDNCDLTAEKIVRKLKADFKPENCISANSDTEAYKNQILLNTLEDENNPIRAVFAVQKLNEGWDVLNLFDIVRLYDTRDGKDGKPGKTTIAEAQLIGRGARYFPFVSEEGQDKYTRKYDNEQNEDLKILEELYYHTKDDSRYISELKAALVETGIYEDPDNFEMKELFLKPEFKETEFYRHGRVVYNKKIPRSYDNITSFADLGVKMTNYRYTLSSGDGSISQAFGEESILEQDVAKKSIDIQLSNIPSHIIKFSLSCNPFFYHSSIIRYFPEVDSINHLIASSDYLAGLAITFEGSEQRIKTITNEDYLQALTALLSQIELEVKGNLTQYQGSEYINEYIHKVFKDKPIRVQKGSERADGQESLVLREKWYVYNANYGTSEEKKFVELFSRKFESINQKYRDVYLIRNERVVKIYDKQGRAFEPDFILFCKQNEGEKITYQVFIEPKGNQLIGFDAWKNDFLKSIQQESKTIQIEMDQYLITAVPFYNYDSENKFADNLQGVLG